ncbi:MAG: hypothetical protein QW785_00965 [Candidatus Anstonellales archaeon]
MITRREFIQSAPYIALGSIMVVSAYLSTRSEVKPRDIKINDAIQVSIKKNGLLIRIDNSKDGLGDVLFSKSDKHRILIEGVYIAFERTKQNVREIFIPAIQTDNTKFYVNDNKYESHNFSSPFRKHVLGFYYVGDENRARELFVNYFKSIQESKSLKILIAAPKYIEGRRDHSDVAHIWSDISENSKALIYRDNNTDKTVIKESVERLIAKLD